MSIKTAQAFFIDELKDIYSAEKQAIRLYPRVSKAVESTDLKEALQTHLEETKGQLARLDQVFGILGKRAAGKTCEGMKGVLAEAQEALDETEKGPLRDAAIIASMQRSEHYEIAAYGTVLALAKAMKQDEIGTLLAATLEEEKLTDKKLTGVSKSINKKAVAADVREVAKQEDDEEGGLEKADNEELPVTKRKMKKT